MEHGTDDATVSFARVDGHLQVALKQSRRLQDMVAVLVTRPEQAHALPSDAEAATSAQELSPSQQHFAEWQKLDGCLQALKQKNVKSLQEDFEQFADVNKEAEDNASQEAQTDALDKIDKIEKIRMSKLGLAALFAAQNMTLGDGEVEELLSRFDTNGDGEVDWREFLALVRSSTEVEMIFKALPVHRVLASCFPRGEADDPLAPFFKQQYSDVVAAMHRAAHMMALMTMSVIKKHNEAHASQEAAGGAKFGAELKGAEIEAFFEGVTGIVGEPHPDLERGIAEEHLLKKDSNECYTTSNYAVSTTPAIEFGLVMKAMRISTGSASKVLQDFIKSGGKGSDEWLTRGEVTRKTITAHGQTLNKVLVSETRCCRQRGGQVPEDLRVLYPIEAFGDFGEDGWLKTPTVCNTDTPLQRKVKKAKLTRMEIIAIILYTGPCFMLYNGMLRGFGDCGEVPSDVESKSDAFWEHLKKVSVKSRMEKAGHKYSSTMHALASGIKKLQAIAEGGQGTRLYRGLGGLDVRPFMEKGFTETAFMSTTGSLEVALDYSGVKAGKVGSVLAIELSSLDNGADICDFSQYPGERETVWNTCAFLEYLHGRDEMHVTPDGVVRVLLVKANANTKALTVEELLRRRKNVVIAFFDTIHNDVVRDMDAAVDTEPFRARLAQEGVLGLPSWFVGVSKDEYKHKLEDYKRAFVQSIKDESAGRVKVYKEKQSSWFASNARLAKAIVDGLDIATLAHAKREIWLRDPTLTLAHMSLKDSPYSYFDFQRAYARFLARQRQELKKAADEAAASAGTADAAQCLQKLEKLALEDCAVRRWIASEDRAELEQPDESTSATPLWTHASRGDVEVAERLLQARAHIDAVPSTDVEGKTALWNAAKEGNTEMVLLLVKYKANVQATAQATYKSTALHEAAWGGHAEVVEVLLQAKSDVCAQNTSDRTPLHLAAKEGYAEVVRALVQAKADVCAQDKLGYTPLDLAVSSNKEDAAEVLCTHGAKRRAELQPVGGWD